MKNLLVFFMMICTMSAFAAAEPGNYKGTLSVTVDADAPQESTQTVTVTDDGSHVTLKIPNFRFPGFPLPLTITIEAVKDNAGNLTLTSINVSGITINDAYLEGTLIDGTCSIGIALQALSHDVLVLFDGAKV